MTESPIHVVRRTKYGLVTTWCGETGQDDPAFATARVEDATCRRCLDAEAEERRTYLQNMHEPLS